MANKTQKINFIKIYDCDGDVRAYKLGEWYLVKKYTWGNEYCWIINKTGRSYTFNSEYFEAYDKGEIEPVLNCKQGKARLKELNGLN